MEGVNRVREESENFAFLMESIMMEYYNQQPPCNTYERGGKLNTITYGLATPKDSPFLLVPTLPRTNSVIISGNNLPRILHNLVESLVKKHGCFRKLFQDVLERFLVTPQNLSELLSPGFC